MKVLFTGGGSMGPVTPLLAVWESWKGIDPDVKAVWVGTPHGPERGVVEDKGIVFFDLPVARLPRYVSVEWVLLPWKFVRAFVRAFRIVKGQKPDLVASAGGYTAVPVIFAAKILGVKVWVHQQDVRAILTNRLTAPFANVLTVAWERNKKQFGSRAHVVGNPVRPSVLNGSVHKGHETFGLHENKPTVLFIGGGGGSRWINERVEEMLEDLLEVANVVHVTGHGKIGSSVSKSGYAVREFLEDEMVDALAVADVVVSRAGLGAITELSALHKASILIPLPHSPQEDNADVVQGACIVMEEYETSSEDLLSQIERLVNDVSLREELGRRMSHVLRTRVADELVELLRR
jgi:UDP-N-acetylglucosamine--N-acetylmuramyl-(pentapeptide) pyrophosphoryl-undecaprenol N-acetylglucosamine transferase